MDLRETLGTAAASLAGHKLRSALTMLGMIFGVGAVIAMLSIGEGAEREAQATIERMGLRNVLVRGLELLPQEAQRVRAKSQGLSPRDELAVAEAVPGVVRVSPRLSIEAWKVRSNLGATSAAVHGVSPAHREVTEIPLAEGRFLDPLDEAGHAQVCVLGQAVRRALFGFGPTLGQPVKVNDVWLEVVGVLASSPPAATASAGAGALPAGAEIYLPLSTARRKFATDPLASPYDELIVHLDPEVSPQRAARQIDELLTRLHAGERDYTIVVPEALLDQARRTQRLFRIVMASIAGISLLVGGIGIMNILLATVLERTREIGVRRAVGAKKRDIRRQFLAEALALAGAGGVAGIVFGFAMAKVVATWAGWATVVTPGAVLLATGVATAVGLASGLYPAARAAGLDPAEALRWE